MEIKEITQTNTREEHIRYYVKVENIRKVNYLVSFNLKDEKPVNIKCDCKWETMQDSKEVRNPKRCRHIKFVEQNMDKILKHEQK